MNQLLALRHSALRNLRGANALAAPLLVIAILALMAVSYTHLTLPTILLV